MELAPGVHKIDGIRGANSYLVMSPGGAAVVDAGLPGNEQKIADYIKAAGVQPGKLDYILLTHPDIDHSGSVFELKRLTGAKVGIHEADAPRLSGKMKLKQVKGAMGVVLGIMGLFVKFKPVTPDVTFKDADRLLDLVVVHTPGHTDGSSSFYREDAVVFSGDALLTSGEGKPRLPPAGFSVDMPTVKESVTKLSKLEFNMLLPGHGAPMTSGAAPSVRAYVSAGFH
jgi:glyoxylase-like metal-dependent hydrolase (beta-lactamase superfamily II)